MPGIRERVRWWSYDRQRLGRRAPDAETALRAVVGVYSSHPSAPLSLHARAQTFDHETFRRLDAERRALRLPAMRGSIHLLPRETAHLAFHAVPEPPSGLRRRLKYFGILEERYAELREVVLAAAQEPRTARYLGRELRETAGYDGSPTPVLAGTAREGVLLRVGAEGPRSNALRYVATQTWIGDDLLEADADGALAWLADEYLRAFGPARPEDFRWWSGVSKGRASAALETVETVEPEAGYLLRADDREAFEAAKAPDPDAVDILPKWDCYTMGYAADGRERFVHPDVQGRVYTPAGDGLGVVLVGGMAAGAWEARFSGKIMEVRLDVFERPGMRLEKILEGRFGEVAAFLGAREVCFLPDTPPRAANTPTHRTPVGRYNKKVNTNGARGGGCELCGRPVERLTRHHLVPRTRHKNKKNKKTFDRQEIHHTVGLCSPCHRHIHTVLDNKELERNHNTLEALRSHPEVEKFVAWICRKPHGTTTACLHRDPCREGNSQT